MILLPIQPQAARKSFRIRLFSVHAHLQCSSDAKLLLMYNGFLSCFFGSHTEASVHVFLSLSLALDLALPLSLVESNLDYLTSHSGVEARTRSDIKSDNQSIDASDAA